MYISPVPLCQTGWTALHYAAKAGWLEVVRFLVESGASGQAECHIGYTPLQYATEENHLTTVSFLLRQPNNVLDLLENKKVGLTSRTVSVVLILRVLRAIGSSITEIQSEI